MQLRSDGEHTLNLSFHLSGWNPLPLASVKDFTGCRKSFCCSQVYKGNKLKMLNSK